MALVPGGLCDSVALVHGGPVALVHGGPVTLVHGGSVSVDEGPRRALPRDAEDGDSFICHLLSISYPHNRQCGFQSE